MVTLQASRKKKGPPYTLLTPHASHGGTTSEYKARRWCCRCFSDQRGLLRSCSARASATKYAIAIQTLIMTSYLTNVLEGVVEMGQVKQWISEGSGLPPASSVATSPRSPTSSDQPQLTVDHFRVLLLNLVEEEADNIFLAAEQQAVNSYSQLSASVKSMRDVKTCHANPHSSWPSGLLNESNFPTLSIVPTKVGKGCLL